MIDISTEDLIPVQAIPDHVPKQPSGKKTHKSAGYRWMKPGIQGVRLETVFIAGCRYTSKQALNRFWHRVTEAKDGVKTGSTSCSHKTKSTSEKELNEAGW
jgi:hypothetical protein